MVKHSAHAHSQVTLLCSCKSSAAAGELKKVIRQFRDAAREASDQVRIIFVKKYFGICFNL